MPKALRTRPRVQAVCPLIASANKGGSRLMTEYSAMQESVKATANRKRRDRTKSQAAALFDNVVEEDDRASGAPVRFLSC